LKEENERTKMNDLDNALAEANKYWSCLYKRQKEIAVAFLASDFCAIQQIFKECGVPKSDWRYYMKSIMECSEKASW
jgi:hypothetical protein